MAPFCIAHSAAAARVETPIMQEAGHKGKPQVALLAARYDE